MSAHLQRVLDYLKTIDPKSDHSIETVIPKCLEEGFPIVLIIAGIGKHYELAHSDVKRLVISHPSSKIDVKELGEFHDTIEKTLLGDETVHRSFRI